MDLQKPIDYLQMFTELLSRRGQLLHQRDEAELELAKVRQLIEAIYPLLPVDKQKSYQEAMDIIDSDTPGLQDVIRLLFSVRRGEWFSASDVRDQLTELGFNFRHYIANPLSAISTTLRRMVPATLEASNETPVRYRRKGLPENHPLRKLAVEYPAVESHNLYGLMKSGVDPVPNSAYESGMRGDEKPKHSGAFYGRLGRLGVDTRKKK